MPSQVHFTKTWKYSFGEDIREKDLRWEVKNHLFERTIIHQYFSSIGTCELDLLAMQLSGFFCSGVHTC